jgi:hypothetical protein
MFDTSIDKTPTPKQTQAISPYLLTWVFVFEPMGFQIRLPLRFAATINEQKSII